MTLAQTHPPRRADGHLTRGTGLSTNTPELRSFIDAAVIPALLDRLRRERSSRT